MNMFLISDTHFSHKGATQFLRADGVTKMRPFDTIEEMDETMIENWNKVVKPTDTVYHIGDVVINRKAFSLLHRLNGEKVLIKGNHDLFRLKEYTPFFKDIRGSHVIDNMILTHIPVHPNSKGRFSGNIHGHLHEKRVMMINDETQIDPWYISACVEHHDYAPVAYEELKKQFQKQNGRIP